MKLFKKFKKPSLSTKVSKVFLLSFCLMIGFIGVVTYIQTRDFKIVLNAVLPCIIGISCILFFAIRYIKKITTEPLCMIYNCIKNFKSDDLDYNIMSFKDLHLETGDEIELLYDALLDSFIVSSYYRVSANKFEEQSEIYKDEAYHDSLTNYRNTRAFTEELDKLSKKMSKDKDFKFAIVMLDVNNLKYVNDTFGHEKGDIYLLGSTSKLRKIFKSTPLYRIGGDEFAIILKGDDYKNRVNYAIQISSVFAEAYSSGKNPWEKYSLSFGIADRESDDSTAEDVLKRADEMMYEYKQQFKQVNMR